MGVNEPELSRRENPHMKISKYGESCNPKREVKGGTSGDAKHLVREQSARSGAFFHVLWFSGFLLRASLNFAPFSSILSFQRSRNHESEVALINSVE